VKFGIETVERLVEPAKSFTVSKWSTYGDPLLSKLDEKLDEAFLAFSPQDDDPHLVSVSSDEDVQKTVYLLYWDRLKDKFVTSQWFTLCNQILMQNAMVQAVTQKVYQPAEMFYYTVMDEFVANESLDQFLDALKEQLGPTWDDRLTPLARAFYKSAKAVNSIVGAGRFMGGAIQLGKSKIHTAIDDLLTRWDQVLGVTDDILDQWLPEKEQKSQEKYEKITVSSESKSIEMGSDEIYMEPEINRDRETTDGIFRMEEDDEKMETKETDIETTTQVRLRGGSSSPQSNKNHFLPVVSTKIMEILPLNFIQRLSSELRSLLSYGTPSWFTHVDDVLLQNSVVRAISQGVMRPAEHFFNTAMVLFRSYYLEIDIFLIQLKQKLGCTWDDRLAVYSKSFFNLAVDLKTKYSSCVSMNFSDSSCESTNSS